MKVPFLNPDIREADIARMAKSVRSGWIARGPYAPKLEAMLAQYLEAPHAVVISSCTAALHTALMLADVGEGDEVITTPLSWVSTSNVILYEGATPVFADVDRATGILDIKEVEKKITKKTRAVILVHLYGQMADMKAYQKLGKKYGIAIIEDAAHALEASRDGYRPGQLGFAACLSFHAAKNITSGQGGALIVNTPEHAARVNLIKRDGVAGTNEHRIMTDFGHMYNLTDFQAALLVGQLARIRATHKKRRALFERYEKAFGGHPAIKVFDQVPGSVHAGHMYMIQVPGEMRDEARGRLKEAGVETSIHYKPIHLEPFYAKTFGFKRGDFPVAEALGDSLITLPTYSRLTKKEQDHVIRSVLSLFR
jgi:dTDP-4-amino-4,6-dideoxygalactose transaminase